MGVLRVTITDTTLERAQRGRFHLSVHSMSSPWQTAVKQRSASVQHLVTCLAGIGLTDDHLAVESVRLASAPGALRGSDSIDFRVTVTVDADQVTGVLAVVADQPHVEVLSLEWLYDDYEASLPVLTEAVAKARRKAEVLAEAAGAYLIGITRLTDRWSIPDRPLPAGGVDLAATRLLTVHLTVDFEILELSPGKRLAPFSLQPRSESVGVGAHWVRWPGERREAEREDPGLVDVTAEPANAA